MQHMKATLITEIHEEFGEGMIHGVIWRVPMPVDPSQHYVKYRLVYVVAGERIVGYDNERGKGDHKHLRHLELPYAFVDSNTLIDDFLRDVSEVTK